MESAVFETLGKSRVLVSLCVPFRLLLCDLDQFVLFFILFLRYSFHPVHSLSSLHKFPLFLLVCVCVCMYVHIHAPGMCVGVGESVGKGGAKGYGVGGGVPALPGERQFHSWFAP